MRLLLGTLLARRMREIARLIPAGPLRAFAAVEDLEVVAVVGGEEDCDVAESFGECWGGVYEERHAPPVEAAPDDAGPGWVAFAHVEGFPVEVTRPGGGNWPTRRKALAGATAWLRAELGPEALILGSRRAIKLLRSNYFTLSISVRNRWTSFCYIITISVHIKAFIVCGFLSVHFYSVLGLINVTTILKGGTCCVTGTVIRFFARC